MDRPDSEWTLLNKCTGAQAERFGAALLSLAGFTAVDPQCPFGGPDGGRDATCRRAGKEYSAAMYFPKGSISFQKVQRKFKGDLAKKSAEVSVGFVFITNQRISPSERRTLSELATERSEEFELIHFERILAMLHTPEGYGVRLEFLGIEMTKEEQISFWSSFKVEHIARAEAQAAVINGMSARLEGFIAERLQKVEDLKGLVALLAFTLRKMDGIVQGWSPPRFDPGSMARRVLDSFEPFRLIYERHLVVCDYLSEVERRAVKMAWDSLEEYLKSLICAHPPEKVESQLGSAVDAVLAQIGPVPGAMTEASEDELVNQLAALLDPYSDGIRKIQLLQHVTENFDSVFARALADRGRGEPET